MKVTYNKIKRLLSEDVNKISDICILQQMQGALTDAWNYINKSEEYGLMKDSFERGFIIPIVDVGAQGFIPRDKFMSLNIENMQTQIQIRLLELYYKEVGK